MRVCVRALPERRAAERLRGRAANESTARSDIGPRLADVSPALARGQEAGGVADAGDLRAAHAAGERRQGFVIHLRRHRPLAQVHLQALQAAAEVGAADLDGAVEAAGTRKGGVKHVLSIRGAHDHDALRLRLEAVHLRQQLVHGVVALVVAGALAAGGARAAHRVQLVDEDDARRQAARGRVGFEGLRVKGLRGFRGFGGFRGFRGFRLYLDFGGLVPQGAGQRGKRQ